MIDVYAPPNAAFDKVPDHGVRYASRWSRLYAFIIDMLVYLTAIGILLFFMPANQTLAMCFVPIQGLLFPFYRFYMQGRSGQTIGQRALNIRVLGSDGGAIGFRRSGRRALLRTLVSIPWVAAKMIALSQVSAGQFSSLGRKGMRALELSLMPGWWESVSVLTGLILLAELVSLLVTARRQTLSDLLANTVVVEVKKCSSRVSHE